MSDPAFDTMMDFDDPKHVEQARRNPFTDRRVAAERVDNWKEKSIHNTYKTT